MNPRRALAASMLAWTALTVPLAPTAQAQSATAQAQSATAQAQSTSQHEVRRGDTLFGVARKARHDGVSRNQMILALWRANQGVFPGGNINILEVGTVLNIPGRDAVAAIEPSEADRLVRELLAKWALPAQVAAIKPAPAIVPPAKVPPGQEQAARRYEEGRAMERRGDHQGAFKAFLEAGEAGYGLAQRRLGELYDVGSPVVKHDYQISLKWYQKAREQGVAIPKPIRRVPSP